MHDISVAQAVTGEIIGKLSGKKPRKIEITMELGELRFHDTSQVEFWLRELLQNEFGKNLSVKADIKVVPPKIKCSACGFSGKIESPMHGNEHSHDHSHHASHNHDHAHDAMAAKCPKCGSEDYEIVSGNECKVSDIRVTV